MSTTTLSWSGNTRPDQGWTSHLALSGITMVTPRGVAATAPRQAATQWLDLHHFSGYQPRHGCTSARPSVSRCFRPIATIAVSYLLGVFASQLRCPETEFITEHCCKRRRACGRVLAAPRRPDATATTVANREPLTAFARYPLCALILPF